MLLVKYRWTYEAEIGLVKDFNYVRQQAESLGQIQNTTEWQLFCSNRRQEISARYQVRERTTLMFYPQPRL